MKKSEVRVYCQPYNGGWLYTVDCNGKEVSFELNKVKYGELHRNIRNSYVANIRKAFKKEGIELHGPTIDFKLRRAR